MSVKSKQVSIKPVISQNQGNIELTGLPRSGKNEGGTDFFSRSRNSVWTQGNSKFYLKVKNQGILLLVSNLVWEWDSLVVKVFSFKEILQKNWVLWLHWWCYCQDFVLSQWVASLTYQLQKKLHQLTPKYVLLNEQRQQLYNIWRADPQTETMDRNPPIRR